MHITKEQLIESWKEDDKKKQQEINKCVWKDNTAKRFVPVDITIEEETENDISFKNYIQSMILMILPIIFLIILEVFIVWNFIHYYLSALLFSSIITFLAGYPYIKYINWLEKKNLI